MIAESLGLVRAGALIPVDDPAVEGEPTDTISARRYAHAALGDRAVVRLIPDSIATAEDLALGFLGLRLTEASAPLARGRRQALGFPGWALVNDPTNGSYALALVKDIERLSRLARSKPGNARDGFDHLGRQLAQSVPHFLPTFYEQAGRAFIEAGNVAQAAGLFGRAREAERVYGLPVDEDRRRQVFLEFALAGALTVRALEDYADQVAEVHTPAAAYAMFRELCLQRTLGGVPPWPGMAIRLQQMARAAQLEPARESESVLRALLETPATRLAGAGFWKAYRQPLVTLAKQQPHVRGLLLNLFPEPQAAADGFEDWWLALLDACGALDGLVGSVPTEAEPTGGPAAWLERTVASLQRGWQPRTSPALVALLPRLAPRLRELGVPVDLIGRRGWRADLGLIDAALVLQIPVAPPASALLRLQQPAYGRTLEHIAKHPDWRPALRSGLDALFQNPRGRLGDLATVSGVQHLLVDWLDDCADALERGGLPQAALVLKQLERAESERTLALNARARARIASTNLAAVLARTLRGGLMDEFGWPALEEVWPKLSSGKGTRVQVGYAWPNLILSDGSTAFVVGPSGVLLEHQFRPPAQLAIPSPTAVLYAGGQLLVTWYRSTGPAGYWSARPGVLFDIKLMARSHWQVGLHASWELADGSRTTGGRALHPGDTSVADEAHMLTDGTTYWQLIIESPSSSHPELKPRSRLREYDPTTGRAGATSLPGFLREFDRDDQSLNLGSCWLLPLVPGLEQTPLGSAGGLLGWRVRSTGGGRAPTFHGQGIDGREFKGGLAPLGFAGWRSGPEQLVAGGLVSVPGDEAHPRPLSLTGQFVSMWSVDGHYEVFQAEVGASAPPLATGTPLVLSPLYWHNLRPRDAAGSRALRVVSDTVATQLLEFATRELGAGPPDREQLPGTAQLIRHLLPQIRDARLLRGVAGVVREAGELARQLAERIEQRVEAAFTAPSFIDSDLYNALRSLVSPGLSGGAFSTRSSTIEQLRAVVGAMRGDPLPRALEAAAVPWAELIGRMGAVVFCAASGATPAQHRATLLALIELWATLPFDSTRSIRVAQVRDYGPGLGLLTDRGARLLRTGGHVWHISEPVWVTRGSYRRWLVEVSPDGSFSVPSGYVLEDERAVHPTWDEPNRLRAVAALIRERGPVPWQAGRVDRLTTLTGLSRAEAALLLAGLPNIDMSTHNFLDKGVRELLGLKLAEASAAQRTLKALPTATRLELLAAAMPDDPAQLWDSEELVERLAAAWLRRFGARTRLPDQLIAQVRSALKTPVEASTLLAAWTEPAAEPPLNREMLTSLALLMPWLFAALPVGDPIRANLPMVLERLRRRLDDPELVVDSRGWTGSVVEAATNFLRSPGATGLAQRVAHGPVAPGGYEANPLLSAATIVDDIVTRLNLDRDSAAVYLQVLTLAEPTVRNLSTWNTWPAARVATAFDTLVERGLLVRASRVRAGRDVFLPGVWEDLKAPNLPIERWKLPLFDNAPLAGRVLALRPLHELFAAAWQMVRDGRGPALEPVPSGRRAQ